MKGLLARRRTRARRNSGGFTLMELMVVVVLIAILAAMAAPTMAAARGDQLMFSYVRQASEIVHNARARAAGRGAAQLVVYSKTSPGGGRGVLIVYKATDGTPLLPVSPNILPGPNPVASCRGTNQWNHVPGFGADGNRRAMIVESLTLEGTGDSINVVEDMRMQGRDSSGDVDAFALCVTPNGTTYFASGGTAATAAQGLQTAMPFTQTAELVFTRRRNGAQAGLRRTIVLTGGAAPRIRSE